MAKKPPPFYFVADSEMYHEFDFLAIIYPGLQKNFKKSII